MRQKLITQLGSSAAVIAVLTFLSFGIGTLESMPSYAVVFVDDTSRTYLAPQCTEHWQRQPTKTFDLLRRTTAGEAYRLHYNPDYACRETGAFSQDGYSLPAHLLAKAGVLPPKKQWGTCPIAPRTASCLPIPSHPILLTCLLKFA